MKNSVKNQFNVLNSVYVVYTVVICVLAVICNVLFYASAQDVIIFCALAVGVCLCYISFNKSSDIKFLFYIARMFLRVT